MTKELFLQLISMCKKIRCSGFRKGFGLSTSKIYVGEFDFFYNEEPYHFCRCSFNLDWEPCDDDLKKYAPYDYVFSLKVCPKVLQFGTSVVLFSSDEEFLKYFSDEHDKVNLIKYFRRTDREIEK